MDYARIEILIEKYWACDTTLEEERELKEFFQTAPKDSKWVKEAALFQYLNNAKEEEHLGVFFDQRVMDEISKVEKRKSHESKNSTISLWQNIGKIAAVLIVLVVAILYVRKEYAEKHDKIQPLVADTFDDPRQAFEETKKALMLISRTMGKGKEQATKIGVFHEAQEIVKEDLTEANDSDNNKNKKKSLRDDSIK